MTSYDLSKFQPSSELSFEGIIKTRVYLRRGTLKYGLNIQFVSAQHATG